MRGNGTTGAVRDADLIRYMDDDLDAAGRKRVDDALAADPGLARRMERLRSRRSRFPASFVARNPDPVPAGTSVAGSGTAAKVIELNAAWAAQQGVEPHVVPPHRPLPGYLRAAVLIVALLALSMLVPPVRTWILEALGSISVR